MKEDDNEAHQSAERSGKAKGERDGKKFTQQKYLELSCHSFLFLMPLTHQICGEAASTRREGNTVGQSTHARMHARRNRHQTDSFHLHDLFDRCYAVIRSRLGSILDLHSAPPRKVCSCECQLWVGTNREWWA